MMQLKVGARHRIVLVGSVVFLILIVCTVDMLKKGRVRWNFWAKEWYPASVNETGEILQYSFVDYSFLAAATKGEEFQGNQENGEKGDESPQCCLQRNGFQGKWLPRTPPVAIDTPEALENLTGCYSLRMTPKFHYHNCYLRDVFLGHDSKWAERKEFDRAAKMLQWEWVQESCSAEATAFDPSSFVEFFRNKTLLYVGDSITEEGFVELKCRLQPFFDLTATLTLLPKNTENQDLKTQKTGFQLLNGGKVYYVRNDALVHPLTDEIQLDESQEVENHLSWASLAVEADVIVFNTGAHSRSVISANRTAKQVIKFLSGLPGDKKRLFFYRTLSAAHVGCSTIQEPNMFNLGNTLYNWFDFTLLDSIWKEHISTLKKITPLVGERFHILDIYPITFPRGDSHSNPPTDCLHFCIPGPLHYGNVLLYANLKCLWQSTES